MNIVKSDNGSIIENKYHDEPIPIMQNVKSVKSDHANTLVLKKDGSLFGWGDRLLNVSPDYKNVSQQGYVFEPIKLADNIKEFYFSETIYIIDQNDNLYQSVYNLENSGFEYITDNVQTINISGYSITILKKDGTLWNFNKFIDPESPSDTQEAPKLILEDVAKIYEKSDVGLALKKDGTLWAWGLNFQFGLPTSSPTTKVLDGVVDVLPYNRLYVILDDGILYLCDGLYNSPPENIYESLVPVLSNVNPDVSAASKGAYTGGYDLFVTNDGKLYGNGRGGSCFMINDPNSEVAYLKPIVLVEPEE